jgi:hypothetical protein
MVEPAIHNSNTFEFGGRRLRLGLNGSRASDLALKAVRKGGLPLEVEDLQLKGAKRPVRIAHPFTTYRSARPED